MVGVMNSCGLIVRQGDSFDVVMQFKDKNAAGLNISGWEIKMQVRGRENGEKKFTVSGEIIDENSGKARIKLNPEQTSMAVGDYDCDIQVTLDQNDVHTIWPQNVNQIGLFRITKQITE